MQPRYCDGNGVCTNAPKPIGSACTASGQCATPSFCIDGVCCNQACNQTCYTCNNGTNPGSCLPLAAGLQDHSATTTCDASNQYCVSGTCQSNKKPNGQTCSTRHRLRQRLLRRRRLLQQLVPGDLSGLQRRRQGSAAA